MASELFYFAADLHGRLDRYRKLFDQVRRRPPRYLLLGGDLLPGGSLLAGEAADRDGFFSDFCLPELSRLKNELAEAFPQILVILGNDDPRCREAEVSELERRSLWRFIHNRRVVAGAYPVYGYGCVPPTPFFLKDWERYDVSRFLDPGTVAPEEGAISQAGSQAAETWPTIQQELEILVDDDDLSQAIMLFHAPPYQTNLDRGALDGKTFDHAPLDVHLGSIAIRRFIESRQPLVTLHGHIHESVRLTGSWRDRIGRTVLFSAAHDGPELALISFDPQNLDAALRQLI